MRKILKPYDKIFNTKKTYIFMKSGRNAGKSEHSAMRIVQDFFEEDGDIVVGRAYISDIYQTIMRDILNIVEELGLSSAVKTRTRPLKIINKLNKNKIHFAGIGGADVHRTKGFKSDKPLSLIVFDELQQVETESHLQEAMQSFLRNLKEDGQVLYMFNPDRRASHWCNELFRMKKHDSEYLTLETTYKDIKKVLNRHTIAEIENAKKYNPMDYRHRFLGETEGLFGAVYSSFRRKTHLLPKDFAKQLLKKVGYHAFIIGADPASARDATALVPKVIMKNGQVLVIDYFYHDPQKNGVVTNTKLRYYIKRWIDEIMHEWGLPPNMPVHMVFDSNAVSQDLMRTLDYVLPPNFSVQVYSQKRVVEMADVVRNGFSRNMILISDSGGYHNYITDIFMHGENPLVRQLEQVVWNEKGDGFDRNVPNDVTDALTYGVNHYLKSKDNMYFIEPKTFYEPVMEDEEVYDGRPRTN